MQNRIEKFQNRIFIFIFMGLPIASLLIKIISYLRYGIDLPFNDDWRGYAMNKMDSLELSYLFNAANGTLAVVGYMFDSLAQRYLDGNSVIYQFLSMSIVLGGLLIFQWKLLSSTLGDKRLAAMCFAFTLLMLQPGTYWGAENMAYHQALPLFFILWTLVLVFLNSSHDGWRLPLILTFGLLAGFSYISGAFAVLSLGFVLFFSSFFANELKFKKIFYRAGFILILVGCVASLTHYVLAIQPNRVGKNIGHFLMAYPTEIDFWLFFLGKVARSLSLSKKFPITSLISTVFISFFAISVFCFCCFKVFKRQFTENKFKFYIIYIALFVIVTMYLMMISAARTHLKDPANLVDSIFLFGFERFHFFWVTIFWPWLVAAIVLFIQKKTSWFKQTYTKFMCEIIFIILVIFMLGAGVIRHKREYQFIAAMREGASNCLRIQLQRGTAIQCPGLPPQWLTSSVPDFAQLYMRAQKMNTSFAGKFPILPVPFGANEPAPLFRLDPNTIKNIKVRNAYTVASATNWRIQAKDDPQLIIAIGKPNEMANCSRLDVAVLMRVDSAAEAQIYYRFFGVENYAPEYTQWIPLSVTSSVLQRLDFQIESPNGFADELRFDPVTLAQQLEIAELEVRCRLPLLSKP